ncbi:hypothetical protein L226DRAFT_89198 [Lentinus tigrinus ALCF2SS1-7]|uniref:uncharacterized protein n=1 Tax=Lentinus tigrinus ALCF2SS1-7 TaxID=1328758 RepID=UPI0011661913|nr:hypothetical protein L226DRAFT_89198 [Lentinus tigrinus ALCF2SS1-7]
MTWSGRRRAGVRVWLALPFKSNQGDIQTYSQVDTIVRRDESQSPAENNSPFLRNLPWIAIAGAILIVFIISALVIWFRGRKYHGIDEPAPEGMQEVPASSSTRTGPMKVLKMSQGRVTPPRQDSLETPQYKDVLRRKLEAGDLMPSRRLQRSVEADSLLQNAVPPALATPPLPAEVPKLPPPAAPSASRLLPTPDLTLSSRPSARPAQFSPSPAPSTVTPPSRAMSKTPPISKITVPDEKPLPNPYAMRDSRMGSVILATPADDQHFPNPYVDSMDGHSPARADTPEPFGSFASFGPVQPLRVAKKNSTGFDSYTRTSTFDSNLYSLPVLDISSASLALSMKSTTSGPSSQNAPRTERR